MCKLSFLLSVLAVISAPAKPSVRVKVCWILHILSPSFLHLINPLTFNPDNKSPVEESKSQPTSFVSTAGLRVFWPCQFKTRAGHLNGSQSEPLNVESGLVSDLPVPTLIIQIPQAFSHGCCSQLFHLLLQKICSVTLLRHFSGNINKKSPLLCFLIT